MALAERGAQPYEQMGLFKVVHPILKRGGELVGWGFRAGEGARGTERLRGEGSQAAKRLVGGKAAELEIFGEEEDGGDAVSAADFDLVGEVAVEIAVDEAEGDGGGVGSGDVVEHGALRGAIAAPDAGGDEDVEAAGERGDEIKLGSGERDASVDALPSLKLIGRAGGDVAVVGEGEVELGLEVRGGEHGVSVVRVERG